jgi:hypothetical protein
MFTNHQLSILTNCTHLSMVLELLWTILQELLRCSAAEPVVGNPILVAGRRDKTDGNSPGKKNGAWGLWGYTCWSHVKNVMNVVNGGFLLSDNCYSQVYIVNMAWGYAGKRQHELQIFHWCHPFQHYETVEIRPVRCSPRTSSPLERIIQNIPRLGSPSPPWKTKHTQLAGPTRTICWWSLRTRTVNCNIYPILHWTWSPPVSSDFLRQRNLLHVLLPITPPQSK